MKKLCASIIVLAFVAAGCQGIAINPQAENVLIKSAARIAGYKLARQNPELAAVVAPQAETLLAAATTADPAQFVDVLYPAAASLLMKKIDDPVLAATVADCISLIQTDADVPVKSAQIQAGLQGFIEGLALARK